MNIIRHNADKILSQFTYACTILCTCDECGPLRRALELHQLYESADEPLRVLPMPIYTAMRDTADPAKLSAILIIALCNRGIDAREPSDKQPGPDGDFVTVGPIEGVDGPLIEIDTPGQVQSFTMARARRSLGSVMTLKPGPESKHSAGMFLETVESMQRKYPFRKQS